MKRIFSTLFSLTVAIVTFAQSSMLATLRHEGETSIYYGASALKDAYEAASNGDVITLSSGSFNAVNLEKALTIRGAGMAIDEATQTEPTLLLGNFTINIPEEVTSRLTLEGIYHNQKITISGNFKNGTFLKDRFYEITGSSATVVENLTMIHCRVANRIEFYTASVSCINCYLSNPASYYDNSFFEFLNCVIAKSRWDSGISASSFKNSILCGGSTALTNPATAYNCVGIGNTSIFNNIQNTTNVVKDYAEVFKTYKDLIYNDDETFELTDDAKTTLLGLDGTQVGVYGGNMPYSSVPSNPQITKCNVAAKSTADGKLSVDITVNGAE